MYRFQLFSNSFRDVGQPVNLCSLWRNNARQIAEAQMAA